LRAKYFSLTDSGNDNIAGSMFQCTGFPNIVHRAWQFLVRILPCGQVLGRSGQKIAKVDIYIYRKYTVECFPNGKLFTDYRTHGIMKYTENI
jgi:hypothetical protein